MSFFLSLLLMVQSAFAIEIIEKEIPFWRAKPEVSRRMFEERAVVVSSRRETVQMLGKEEIRFTIKGAGIVNAPRVFSFKEAQSYDKLKAISSHFKTVTYTPANQNLHLVMEALGYEADMVLKMEPVTTELRDELQWTVIAGHFKGMRGVLAFESVVSGKFGGKLGGKTESSIDAVYQAETLPLPKILMGVALEAIFQKVAEKMRSAIETEYKIAVKP
jgi:hypothetical protein